MKNNNILIDYIQGAHYIMYFLVELLGNSNYKNIIYIYQYITSKYDFIYDIRKNYMLLEEIDKELIIEHEIYDYYKNKCIEETGMNYILDSKLYFLIT